MSAGKSSFAIQGTTTTASPGRIGTGSVSQVVDEVEAKSLELTVPAGESRTVNLALPTGVEEALLLQWYCAQKLDLTITDNTGSDTISLTAKGFSLLTLAPGGGIKELSITNPSTTEDVLFVYTVVTKAVDGDEPAFWR